VPDLAGVLEAGRSPPDSLGRCSRGPQLPPIGSRDQQIPGVMKGRPANGGRGSRAAISGARRWANAVARRDRQIGAFGSGSVPLVSRPLGGRGHPFCAPRRNSEVKWKEKCKCECKRSGNVGVKCKCKNSGDCPAEPTSSSKLWAAENGRPVRQSGNQAQRSAPKGCCVWTCSSVSLPLPFTVRSLSGPRS
jgi:hypothetical protein